MMREKTLSSSSSLERDSSHDEAGSLYSASTEERSSSTGTEKSAKEIQEELAAKETRDVNRGRAIVIAVLLSFTILCAALTFTFTRREEEKDFEHEVSTKL